MEKGEVVSYSSLSILKWLDSQFSTSISVLSAIERTLHSHPLDVEYPYPIGSTPALNFELRASTMLAVLIACGSAYIFDQRSKEHLGNQMSKI